jgi:hypothetical protein
LCPSEHDTGKNPQGARQVTKLSGKRRADQWARPGDRGEMMTKHHPAISRHEVTPIITTHGWCFMLITQRKNFRGNKATVEAIANGIDTQGGDNKPDRIDALPSVQRNHAHCPGSNATQYNP